MALRRRFGLLTLAILAFWALVMFGNEISEAVIHQGSLAVPMLGIALCVAAAYAADTRFAIALVAVNAIFVLVLYVPSLHAAAGNDVLRLRRASPARSPSPASSSIAWFQPWVILIRPLRSRPSRVPAI